MHMCYLCVEIFSKIGVCAQKSKMKKQKGAPWRKYFSLSGGILSYPHSLAGICKMNVSLLAEWMIRAQYSVLDMEKILYIVYVVLCKR